MNSAAGNHPCEKKPASRDEIPGWKSSLPDNSAESGCISPLEFIPTRHFLLIRMHFPAGIHPYKSFSANQDDFLRWKSSLESNSAESG